MESHENLIGGARRPPAAGLRFAARAGEAPSWPRSTSRDVQVALDALALGAGAWAACPRRERARLVAEASRALVEDPDPDRRLARAVGLDADETLEGPAPGRLRIAGDEDLVPRGGAGEIALVRAHVSELLEGPARATFTELVRGRAVLLLSSGELPEAAARVADALRAAGLPPGALALIHDDGESCLGAALDAGRARRVRVCAPRGRIDALRRRVARVPLRTSFGVGVAAAAELATGRFDVPRSVPVDVGEAEDPIEAAWSVAKGAFGRRETLGGQTAGRVGLVRVAPRSFSRFTTALLAELETNDGRYLPPRWLDPRLPERLETLRTRGVDEGATLIHAPQRAGSRSTSGRATLLRLVFTNVEPGMRIAQDLDAAPVLLLARAADAAAAGRSAPSGSRPTVPDPTVPDLTVPDLTGPDLEP